ncbi:MAG: Fe-S protein assembly co-chaperone HscB [Thermodesulfobacteriota bacterium]
MTRIRCRRCADVQPPAFFCRSCEALQLLPQDSDYFAVLGLPSHPAVDEQRLEERYYALSRKLHPDRFQTASADEQRASVQATALLNAAYRTLRDVETRGRYWLARCGEDLGRDNNRVPPRLAAYVFDVQEKMSELRESSNGGAASLRRELSEAHRDLTERRNRERTALAELLRGWPAGDGEPTARDERGAAAVRELKALLSELSYLRTLDRDLQAALAEGAGAEA